MKVVHQLIHYFHQRGAFSDREIEHLFNEGYWPEDIEYDVSSSLGSANSALHEVLTPVEQLEVEFANLPRKCRRGTNRCNLTPQQLCSRINERSKNWDKPLRPFVSLANHLRNAECHTWPDALPTLRNTDERALHEAVCRTIDKGDLSMHALQQALRWEDYRSVLAGSGLRGETASAYRMMLRANSYAELGKYGWILRHAEVKNIFNLIQAKKRIRLAV